MCSCLCVHRHECSVRVCVLLCERLCEIKLFLPISDLSGELKDCVWPWALRKKSSSLPLSSPELSRRLFQCFRKSPNEMEPVPRPSEGGLRDLTTRRQQRPFLSLSLCLFAAHFFLLPLHYISNSLPVFRLLVFFFFNLKISALGFPTDQKKQNLILSLWPRRAVAQMNFDPVVLQLVVQ